MSGDRKYDNSGTLFKNDRKEQPNHADYKGSAMIDGVEYWMNAWIKEGKESGKKFMSFSFQPKTKQSGGRSGGGSSRSSETSDQDEFAF